MKSCIFQYIEDQICMASIQYGMTNIILWDYVHISWYEHWVWVLYGALHIVCQHIYVHSITSCAPDDLFAGIPQVSVSAQFLSCSPGAYWPQYVLIVYLFARFRLVKYILPVYVGLGPNLHTCIYLQFMCITCLWM